MPRNRKVNEKQINFDLDKETIERLNDYCDREGVKKKFVVEVAIIKYLNIKEKRAAQ